MSKREGRVVVLNGTSSAGKTTVAESFVETRAARGEWWIVVGVDDFLSKLRWQWFRGGEFDGPFADVGVRFEPPCGGPGLIVRVGDNGRQLYAVYRRSVALWARHGFDVIVDEVVIDELAAEDWDAALAGLTVHWVAVRCAPDVAAAREEARGDRVIGLARGLSPVVHCYRVHDLELDAGTEEPAALAEKLDDFVTATATAAPTAEDG